MLVRILSFALCLAVSGWALGPAFAVKEVRRDLSKEFEDLTPSEKIAIRAAAKVAYKAKKLQTLKVCAEIERLEADADHVMRSAMAKLFREEPDAKQIIKLKDIYQLLESVTDKCDDVANIIESIVLENA